MSSDSPARSEPPPPQREGAPRPLEGITVVAIEHAIAAPYCTRQLADLGERIDRLRREKAL
jgi:itaconate CoA-transferase